MKRSFQEGIELDRSLNIASCLMFLAKGTDFDGVNNVAESGRVFECKTCNRQFPSFQALGGHRASHKKPRAPPDGNNSGAVTPLFPMKPKTHECSVCGLEFAIGQALGGHMRRHRASSIGGLHGHGNDQKVPLLSSTFPNTTPLLMKKANSRRVLCFDLNLTPYENTMLS